MVNPFDQLNQDLHVQLSADDVAHLAIVSKMTEIDRFRRHAAQSAIDARAAGLQTSAKYWDRSADFWMARYVELC